MCGIFGYFDSQGAMPRERSSRLAKGLARQAQKRGADAAGYAVLVDSEIAIVKKAAPASALCFDTMGSPVLIGHTRFATMGDPTADRQAHPFLSADGGMALTHNGVATADFQRLKAEMGLKAEIDSEGMLRYIEGEGLSGASLLRFYADWGASGFAIAILNREGASLSMFRNEKNPLVIAETREGVVVYGSTREIILSGCVPAGLEVRKLSSLAPGKLLRIGREEA
jgi:glucosamine 6-phosphate synthetase-like amidotransferase/phosphosugar isomerase protein